MPTLVPTVVFRCRRPGWLTVSSPPEFQATLSAIPGVRREGGTDIVPAELLGPLTEEAKRNEFHTQFFLETGRRKTDKNPKLKLNPKLYEYQARDVARAVFLGHFIYNYETGLGKTAPAIEAARITQAEYILVICPALVREHWQRELDKWWSEHPEVAIYETGKDFADGLANITITSYELAKYIDPKLAWDAIIVDELHYIKTGTAGRSKTLRKILSYNEDALAMGLTATPMTKEPKDLHHQLDALWPGRFGNFWKFANRYCIVEKSRFGTNITGLNEDHADELNGRLDELSSRVTKQEVAHLLPPFLVQATRIAPKRKHNVREVLEDFSSCVRKKHEQRLDGLILRATSDKIRKVVEQVDQGLESGNKVCVLTHFRSSVDSIADELQARLGINTVRITGDLAMKKRMRAIEHACTSNDVMVATMHSVNVGIDLTAFTVAVFAELYWQPAEVIQAIGRFSRLSGTLPSTCYLMVMEGTLDEIIADTLFNRLRDIGQLQKSSAAEKQVIDQFDPDNVDETELLKDLLAAASQRVEEDEYL